VPVAGVSVFSWHDSRRRQLALVLLVTAIPVMPMLLFGYHRGHDLEIHLESWMEAAAQFHQGIWFPRWASGANYGFGEPRFIFYPPGSWALGGILGTVLPWTVVPAIFVWLSMVLAAVGMRKLATDWLPPDGALIAALLYAINPYLIVTAYSRCAYGELLASAVFPFLLWGAFRIQSDPAKGFATVAISLAAIWISNLPAGVIATYALALVLLIGSVLLRSIRSLLYGAVSALTGLGLAAFALLPAAWEQKWVDIDAVVGPKQLPQANFLFSPFGVANMYKFNHHLSPLAVLLILGAIASAIAGRRMRCGTPAVWWSLTVLCLVSGFLMLPVSAMIWRALPELRFVQFPWRWLFPMCAAAALLASFALVQSNRKRTLLPVLGFVLVAVNASIICAEQVFPHFVTQVAEEFHAHGYSGLMEYTPVAGKNRHLPADAPLIAAVEPSNPRQPASTPAGVYVEVWSPERKVIRADLPHSMTVNLKLLAYPAWRASVNGEPAALLDNSETGQIMVVLPAGASRTEIKFAQTWDRAVGAEISIGSGAVLIAFWQLIVAVSRRATEPRDAEAITVKAA
jgi:uncharacterized membrane protein